MQLGFGNNPSAFLPDRFVRLFFLFKSCRHFGDFKLLPVTGGRFRLCFFFRDKQRRRFRDFKLLRRPNGRFRLCFLFWYKQCRRFRDFRLCRLFGNVFRFFYRHNSLLLIPLNLFKIAICGTLRIQAAVRLFTAADQMIASHGYAPGHGANFLHANRRPHGQGFLLRRSHPGHIRVGVHSVFILPQY